MTRIVIRLYDDVLDRRDTVAIIGSRQLVRREVSRHVPADDPPAITTGPAPAAVVPWQPAGNLLVNNQHDRTSLVLDAISHRRRGNRGFEKRLATQVTFVSLHLVFGCSPALEEGSCTTLCPVAGDRDRRYPTSCPQNHAGIPCMSS
jgi:hypothetical protein